MTNLPGLNFQLGDDVDALREGQAGQRGRAGQCAGGEEVSASNGHRRLLERFGAEDFGLGSEEIVF